MLWTDIKLRACAVLAGLATLVPVSTSAQQLPPQAAPARFEVRAWPDGAVAVAGAALSALSFVQSDSVVSPCPCDPARLPRWDRGSVGMVHQRAAAWSYVSLGATVGLAGAGLALARRGEGGGAVAEDLALLTQAVALANGLTQAMKTVAARSRPNLYAAPPGVRVARTDVEAFPSGHTSNAFAAAAAYWSIQQRRGVAGRHGAEVAGLFALAGVTAGLRVAAHKHFPSDVVAGAILGTAVGWALPRLHRLR